MMPCWFQNGLNIHESTLGTLIRVTTDRSSTIAACPPRLFELHAKSETWFLAGPGLCLKQTVANRTSMVNCRKQPSFTEMRRVCARCPHAACECHMQTCASLWASEHFLQNNDPASKVSSCDERQMTANATALEQHDNK